MFSSFSMSKPRLRSVSMQISTRALLRVRRLERREPAHVRAVERRRHVVALGAEQPVEPALAQLAPSASSTAALAAASVCSSSRSEICFSSSLRATFSAIAGQLGLERLALRQQLERGRVERRRRVRLERAELLAVGVVVEHGELRLRVPQRHLLALPRDARGEDLVLELVLRLGELSGGETAFAGLAEAVEPLALVAVRGLLLALAQRRELRAREEIGVPRDDRRLLRSLLLAHADRAAFLGTLVEVLLQPLLVLGRAPHCLGDAHRGKSTTGYDRAASEADAGTGSPRTYAAAMAGLWIDLRADAGPPRRARRRIRTGCSRIAMTFPALQYDLHRAAELVSGLTPPAGAAAVHDEVARGARRGARADGRDRRGACVRRREAAAPLVWEWRGVLFRVRFARRRLERPRLAARTRVAARGRRDGLPGSSSRRARSTSARCSCSSRRCSASGCSSRSTLAGTVAGSVLLRP